MAPAPSTPTAAHWEGVHAEKGAGDVSWWQEPDSLWLDLIERAGVSPANPVVDVDAGASQLADALWHDRAVFHFLTDPADRAAYRESLLANLTPGGVAVLAVFAPDGPETCSGLPVRRYDVPELVNEIGPGFTLVHGERRVHTTPWGAEQPFTVALLRRD